MSKRGAFSFMLHTHLPYTRRAGRWPHGEEWLHEAVLECYVPLLDVLWRLWGEGVPFRLALDMTPVLVEQLRDPEVQGHFVEYAADRIRRAREDQPRFAAEGNEAMAWLAGFYADRYQRILDSFVHRYGGDVVGAIRSLQDSGHVEVATSAATHGYLPLLQRDSSIYGQLASGVKSYRHHFGRAPTSIWLPECAYRAACLAEEPELREQGYVRPGLEEFLQELGLKVFFVESHAIEGGEPMGKAAGDVIGPYALPRRRRPPQRPEFPRGGTTYQAYWVESSRVAVVARNVRTGLQVWSATWGYPGDYWYREFHKKEWRSGLQYWRVTDAARDLGSKALYEPHRAMERMHQHAWHFSDLVTGLLQEHYGQTGRPGLVLAAYDMELFGHWWFEGVEWLGEVLRRLAASDAVDLTTPTAYVEAHPPEQAIALPESSWGQGGTHYVWYNPDNEWMWPLIHDAEARMERLVGRFLHAGGPVREALGQAAREKLLLEASDWPFLITTRQAAEYAAQRFHEHLGRFHELADALERSDGEVDLGLVHHLRTLDNPFPYIDHLDFRRREPAG